MRLTDTERKELASAVDEMRRASATVDRLIGIGLARPDTDPKAIDSLMKCGGWVGTAASNGASALTRLEELAGEAAGGDARPLPIRPSGSAAVP